MSPSITSRVAIVTSTRADYSILLPVAAELSRRSEVQVGWIASGTHVSHEFGHTIDEVRKSGIDIWDTVRFVLADDSDESLVMSNGMAMTGYGQALHRIQPALVLLLGDRWEIHACATAAALLRLPVAHIHGGEETEGAIDNMFRHAITKLSHLHFVATELSGQRVRQMGEPDDRVFVTGSPAIDKFNGIQKLDLETLADKAGVPPQPFLIATYHPVTTDLAATRSGFDSLLSVLEELALPTLFTFSNADSFGRTINAEISAFCDRHEFASVVPSLGGDAFANAMGHALAMVGNSSSGIIEAACFGLPVVNIGDRQFGRERSGNSIETNESRENILVALRKALSPEFREHCAATKNVYGDGLAAPRIAEAISGFLAGEKTVAKRFALRT
ncbi:MAG: UDP-N-acetylglucosamine 2-epimerase [Rhizobiaceae bacterium]